MTIHHKLLTHRPLRKDIITATLTTRQKLLMRLRSEFPQIAELKNASIMRTYAGKWQRQAGAWLWQIDADSLYPAYGSQYTMTDCLSAKKLEISCRNQPWESQEDFDIDVVPEKK